MISLSLLVLVIVVGFVVYGVVRSRSGMSDRIVPTNGASRGVGGPRVTELRRWVEAGLITDAQAEAIVDFESVERAATSTGTSPAIEALAYVGGVLLAVGAGMLVSRFWDRMGAAAHLGIIATAAIVTGVVGALVGEDEPATWRLRGFLWALSTGGIATTAGLFVFEVLHRIGEPVAFATAVTGAVASAAYWMLRDRPLQHLSTFIGLAVTIGVTIAWIDTGNPGAWIGLGLWSFGVVWAAAAWRDLVPPALVGFPLGVVLTLVGAGVVGVRYDWLAPLLGLATAAAWTAIGIFVNEGLALAPGVIGVFVYLPWTLGRFFGGSLGAPMIVMLSGALLLGIVVLLWRRRSRGASIGDLWGGHFAMNAPRATSGR